MREIIPPLCFFLALAMLVTGFTLLAAGLPEETVELHRARAGGDELATQQLENSLRQQRTTRTILIAVTLIGSVVVTIAGFRAMRPR